MEEQEELSTPFGKIERGISGKEDIARFGPCLAGEGERTNLLLEEPFDAMHTNLQGVTRMKVRHVPPSGISSEVNAFLIKGRTEAFNIQIVVPTIEPHLGYTFSFYGCVKGTERQYIDVMITDGLEMSAILCEVTMEERRYHISKEFRVTPGQLWVVFRSSELFPPTEEYQLIVEYMVVEEGLFPTNYFGANPSLPFQRPAQKYTLPADRLQASKGTILLFFRPEWHGHELEWQERAVIFEWYKENRVSLYADGSNYGMFTLEATISGRSSSIQSNVIPMMNELYCLCLRWSNGIIELLLDGRAACVDAVREGLEMPARETLGNQITLLHGHESRTSAFGYLHPTDRENVDSTQENYPLLLLLHHVRVNTRWLSDRDIRAVMFYMYAGLYPTYRYDWDQLAGALDAQMYRQSDWHSQIAQFLLRLEDIWHQTPPGWFAKESIDEGMCRDEVFRMMNADPDRWSPAIEFVSPDNGRTDLYLEDKQRDERVRIEFKVWGRTGYKDVPKQPIRYFSSNERFGVVVMINQNKSSVAQKYRQNVLQSPTSCIGYCDLPFEANYFSDHFVSHHRTKEGVAFEVLHVVVNKLPLAQSLISSPNGQFSLPSSSQLGTKT